MPKIKFFTWLLLMDRLNTRDVLRRRKKFEEEGYSCALWHEHVQETVFHLFFGCQSSVTRWFAIGIQWHNSGDVCQMIVHQKSLFRGRFFMDLFMLPAWNIGRNIMIIFLIVEHLHWLPGRKFSRMKLNFISLGSLPQNVFQLCIG